MAAVSGPQKAVLAGGWRRFYGFSAVPRNPGGCFGPRFAAKKGGDEEAHFLVFFTKKKKKKTADL